MSKHSPRMQGNPGGTCPEYGISSIGKDGQEWERCPVCGHEGRAGNCPNCGKGFYEIDPATKVRRRIEDYLRKVDDDTVMRIANDLNIKLT